MLPLTEKAAPVHVTGRVPFWPLDRCEPVASSVMPDMADSSAGFAGSAGWSDEPGERPPPERPRSGRVIPGYLVDSEPEQPRPAAVPVRHPVPPARPGPLEYGPGPRQPVPAPPVQNAPSQPLPVQDPPAQNTPARRRRHAAGPWMPAPNSPPPAAPPLAGTVLPTPEPAGRARAARPLAPAGPVSAPATPTSALAPPGPRPDTAWPPPAAAPEPSPLVGPGLVAPLVERSEPWPAPSPPAEPVVAPELRETRRQPGQPRGRRARPKPLGLAKTSLVLAAALGTAFALYHLQLADRRSSGSVQALEVPDPSEPFAGTPAAHWAAGAEGLVADAAKPTGSFSAAQVATALRTSRALLAAGNLDPAVLGGAYPTRYQSLLSQLDREQLQQALRHPAGSDDPTGYVTRFDPRVTRLHGNEVRTRGRLMYQALSANHLRVRADALFVYPVRVLPGDGNPTEVVVRIVARRGLDLDFYQGRPDLPLTVASLGRLESGFAGAACRSANGYVEPLLVPPTAAAGGGAPDPYDQRAPSGGPDDCRLVRGT